MAEKIEKTIEKALAIIFEMNFDSDGMCKIYAAVLQQSLSNQDIYSKIVNTQKLGASYEHEALLVYGDNKYFLVDPSFDQFEKKDHKYLTASFKEYPAEVIKKQDINLYHNLKEEKYSRINDQSLATYLRAIDQDGLIDKISLREIIFPSPQR